MTEAEILLEIAEINTALSHIRKGGQSYTITSASGAGTSRMVTMADYNTLVKDKIRLENLLASVQNKRSYRITPAW